MNRRSISATGFVPKQVAAFGNDTRGAVAIIFSLCLFMLLALIGGAVDLGTAYRQRDMQLTAADAASLSVVANGSDSYNLAAAMTTDGPVARAEAAAKATFLGEIADQDGPISVVPSATVIKQGATVTATVSFTAKIPSHFRGLFGMDTIALTGHATSVNGTPAFIDFYLLLDNSPSMGIAATPGDIATMVAGTPEQCAFACHEADKEGHDYYTKAHDLGVTTRIDVLRQATQKLMDTASTTASVPGQFRMSIDTFNIDLHAISPLTTDLAAAKVDAAAIDLMEVPA